MASVFKSIRQTLLSKPLMGWYRSVLPPLSDTERQALDAGDIWWEAQLFAGAPDWKMLRETPRPRLSDRERRFMEGPVEQLCDMLDDWEIEETRRDLPPAVWAFLKEHKFFGMIIPEQYDGLEFSAYAHSEVVKKISTRSVTAAVTVMVPNSLGPGELLLLYGTQEQRDRYLPRLAKGEEIPCFALTGVDAGSDAGAMTDTGVVCKREWNGEETLGLRLNWEKRYITLGPVATIMGLAFKLSDPDHLLSEETERGITVALVPTNLPGVEMGDRHYPSKLAFQNGPTHGRDVFIPLDYILGGQEQIGQGWKMLMGALAAGRGISLPSLSTGAAQFAARTSGAYARIREQFGVPVGKFEGVREPLARIAGAAYLLESGRRLTSAGIDAGKNPAIVSAIMKYHATTRMREAVNDAMDIHGGKAICTGPKNYLDTPYRAIPIGITVEGANILTRSLIIFGQGGIRCHPYLVREMDAVANEDRKAGLADFDDALWGHIGYQFASAWRSFWRNVTGGWGAPAPDAGALNPYYKQLSRASASLAIASEISFAILGGRLKRMETLSARLGDVLAELYLLSAALKRFEDDGRPEADKPLLDWCFATGLRTVEERLDDVARNFPNSIWGGLMHFFVLPTGRHRKGPSDKLMNACAKLLQSPSETRDRLTHGIHLGPETAETAKLEAAFLDVIATQDLRRKMKDADIEDIDQAKARGVLSEDEAARLAEVARKVREVIMVDAYAPEELTGAREGGDKGGPEDRYPRIAAST